MIKGGTGALLSMVHFSLIIIMQQGLLLLSLLLLLELVFIDFHNIWATAWQNQQNDVHPAKTQISLGIHLVWSECLLSAWRNLGSLATHWGHSELWSVWADAHADLSFSLGLHVNLLVLSYDSSSGMDTNFFGLEARTAIHVILTLW